MCVDTIGETLKAAAKYSRPIDKFSLYGYGNGFWLNMANSKTQAEAEHLFSNVEHEPEFIQ